MLAFYKVNEVVPAVSVARAIDDGLNIDMESCTISGPLEVTRVAAEGKISIRKTRFDEPVVFRNVTFSGPRVEFLNCEFIRGVTFSDSTFSEVETHVRFDESRFYEVASFQNTRFNRVASFRKSDFRENAIFADVVFARKADFRESVFRKEADFGSASFNGSTDFRSATFVEQVDFAQAYLRLPANFAKVDFRENTIRRWLWKHVLRYILRYPMFLLLCFASLVLEIWKNRKELHQAVQFACKEWRSRNRKEPSAQSICRICKKLQENVRSICPFSYLQASRLIRSEWERICLWEVTTDFYSLNTDNVMDGSSNAYLKRYIEEEQWLESWRTSRSWRKPVFVVWELTSHCGRSFWLWAVWAVTIVVVFAGIYNHWVDIVYNVSDLADKIKPHEPDFLTYVYYSIVTFTTLGFGDIIPLDNKARVAVWSEVVLGYIMLAVLLTIVGNRVARPS